MIHVGWPQGIYIMIFALNLISGAILDGDPKTGKHKFSITLCGTILSVGLLYWGGFFS